MTINEKINKLSSEKPYVVITNADIIEKFTAKIEELEKQIDMLNEVVSGLCDRVDYLESRL